jgi:uncharacterized oxidoreductase
MTAVTEPSEPEGVGAGAERVAPAALRDLIAEIMRRDGCSDAEADAVANHLVDATATGHDSHGVIRTPRYHRWIGDGTLRPRTAPKVLVDTGPLVQIDGCHGVGQYLANEGLSMGLERCAAHGMALVAMRNGGHIGRLGAYAEAACAQGFVSVQFVNVAGGRLVAPFGAAEKAVSTAPVAVGVPNADGDFILDFSTAVVAEGKALVAAQGGKALPAEALIGADGKRTADPAALYGDSIHTSIPDARSGAGALRAMGEHKGSGLALACELLAGALTGGGASGPTKHPFGNGWLLLLVDPMRLDNPLGFAAEVSSFVDWVHGLKPDADTDRILVPGDKEREMRAERLANGLPIPAPVLREILTVAQALSIPLDRRDLDATPGG